MTRVVSPNSVEIDVTDHGLRVVHVEGVMKISPSRFGRREPAAVMNEDVEDDDEFVVEEIIAHTMRGSNPWFKVRWAGFDRPTWQRGSLLLEDVPEMVKEYVATQKLSRKKYLT